MYSIVYHSFALPVFTEDAIPGMLYNAREMNRKFSITRCLLYHNRKFLQLIEGEEVFVKQLYRNILNDQRHHQIVTINSEAHPDRIFNKWSMVYNDLNVASNKIEDKRVLFDSIFHQSLQTQILNSSTLKLWHHVHHVLDDEGMLEER